MMLGLTGTAYWFSLNIMSSFPVVANTIAILNCFVVLYIARSRFVSNDNTGPSNAAVAGDDASRAYVRRVTHVERAEPFVIPSVKVRKLSSVVGSNVVIMATFAASRPRASKNLPMRGALFLGSNVYQWPSTNASNQSAKSPGG